MFRHSAMVRSKITYYAMLTPERRYEIQQEIQTRKAMRAACITVGLPLDSSEPDMEEERPGKKEDDKMAPMEVEEVKQQEPELPEQELSGYNTEQAEAEFSVTQCCEMAKQQAILESVQDEAYVEANRAFLRREESESDVLFTELNAEEAGAEQRETPEEAELQVPPMLPKPGTEIIDISDED